MSSRLFVGNLPWSATEEQIQEVFAGAGEVSSVEIKTDRETGRAKGYGFVQMASDEAAQDAIAKLNGYELEGRKLTVNEARPLPPRQ
jgi:RNA recognition motif-containing protein